MKITRATLVEGFAVRGAYRRLRRWRAGDIAALASGASRATRRPKSTKRAILTCSSPRQRRWCARRRTAAVKCSFRSRPWRRALGPAVVNVYAQRVVALDGARSVLRPLQRAAG
jgi:hypothetical protein